jgi:hypothetical protein
LQVAQAIDRFLPFWVRVYGVAGHGFWELGILRS